MRVRNCLPDLDARGFKDYDRKFFWYVCYSVHPEYTMTVINKAKRLRMAMPAKEGVRLNEIISD